VWELLLNLASSIEGSTKHILKPVEQPASRIRVYFHLGIIGMILLIIAYLLNANAGMGLSQGTYAIIFFLKFVGVILVGVAFLGYWRSYQSKIALVAIGYSILFTGITVTALFLSFQFWLSIIITQPAFIIFIFSGMFTLLALDLLIGFGLIIWGIAFGKILISSKSHSIEKNTATFFIIAGILAISANLLYFLSIFVCVAAALGALRFYRSLELIEPDFYYERDSTLLIMMIRWSGVTLCTMGIIIALYFYTTYYLSGFTGSPRYPWMTP